LRPLKEIVMHLLPSILASLLLLTACATQTMQTPPAGMPAEVGASPLQPGSVWRYAVRDGYTGQARGTVEYRVREIAGDVVRVDVRSPHEQTTELYARDGNWLQRPATNMQVFSYRPAYTAFDFPLFSGKRWEARATATDPADGRSFPVLIRGHVAGWKRIQVPAGTFDALEVRRTVYLDYFELGVRGQSIIYETDWYAPSLHRSVRKETISKYLKLADARPTSGFIRVSDDDHSDGGGVPYWERDDWLVYELVVHDR
jgi:hypothetical protein